MQLMNNETRTTRYELRDTLHERRATSNQRRLSFHEIRDTKYEIRSLKYASRFTLHASRSSPGFSLLEMIGVLAIVGILAAMILPKFIDQIEDATRTAEGQNLQAIAQAIELYLQEQHSWPVNLQALSPEYLQMGDAALTQNRGNQPRYYILHPTMATFDNAAGIAANEVQDTRYLLISNVSTDVAPTITNAAEFDAWWDTDETANPDLFIERGSVGHLFRLVNLLADTTGGSYSIDGTITNSGCGITLNHLRYHLVGTRVGMDEALPYSVPEIQFIVHDDTTHHLNPCRPAGLQWRSGPILVQACAGLGGCGSGGGLWLTTGADVASPSGAPGLDSWTDATVLLFSDPNLAFEPGTTNGTFSAAINMESVALDGQLASLTALHYVTTDITVGTTTSYNLLAGDLLFAHNSGNEEITPPYIWGDNWELYVYRPNTPGDYSSGTLYLLLNDFASGHVHSISLVETNTVVGDTTLQAGTFLYSTSGATKNDIHHFSPIRVGNTTTGTNSTLLDGGALGIANNNELQGLALIQTTLTVGATTLPPGTILVTLHNDDAGIGSNSLATKAQDIFYLNVTGTELGSGTAATATILLEGADVGLDTANESLWGISVAP
jgi:prepilin-type N-terminal cleavage/methylation domain-containing protein